MKKTGSFICLSALSLVLSVPAYASLSTIDIANSYDGGNYTVQMKFDLDDAYRYAFPAGWQHSPGSLDLYISNFTYSIGGALGSAISLTNPMFGLNAPDGSWDGIGFDDFDLEGFFGGSEYIFDRFNVDCALCNPTIYKAADGDPKITITPVVVSVPEPAGLGLFGLGLAALAFHRRRNTDVSANPWSGAVA